VLGVMSVCDEKPETNLVLLDDAFQHRGIKPGLNILLTAYDKPFYRDFILPVGNLREFRSAKKRADLIIVTKCPSFDQIDKSSIIRSIAPANDQPVFFSSIKYGALVPVSAAENRSVTGPLKIVLVTGIADASPLKDHLAKTHEIVHHFNFPDHHNFTGADILKIHNLFDTFAGPETIVLTTEKDAMRLIGPDLENQLEKYPWFYQSIEIEINEQQRFDQLILDYAQKNN
jgi:tetraacyldisaccharide 4'-kinase